MAFFTDTDSFHKVRVASVLFTKLLHVGSSGGIRCTYIHTSMYGIRKLGGKKPIRISYNKPKHTGITTKSLVICKLAVRAGRGGGGAMDF